MTDYPVLIQAETGTGKDILANYIHQNGMRREKQFVPVNCAAIPHELLYSELFGHTKGAFTGATSDKPGKFQRADGGTIFLDEIGDIEPRVQLALLRVLEDKKIYPLGSKTEKTVDVRIICATHRDIRDPAGREKVGFRDDLYYRLRVLPLDIPPIRESPRDLIFLFLLFLYNENTRSRFECRFFPLGLIEEMLWYPWPGNVRELHNFALFYIQYCLVMRENNRKRFPKGNLHAFFTQNDALHEFISDVQFHEVQKKIVDVSMPLMTCFGDLNYFTAIDLVGLQDFLLQPPSSRPTPDFDYQFGYTERAVRFLFYISSGNEEYLHELSPEPTRPSSDSLRELFRPGNKDFRKYPEVRDLAMSYYFYEVIRWNRTATDHEIARIAGVHHNTVKKIREKYKLLPRINQNRQKLSQRDSPSDPTS